MDPVAEAPVKSEAELVNLCKYLADKGAVPINSLPERFRVGSGSPLLSKALVMDYIEIGQKQYAVVNTEVRVRVDPKTGAQTVEKTPTAHVSDEWTWTDLKGPKRKQLWELLDEVKEEKLPDEVQLHVRLTSGGMAMTV